MTAGFKTTVYAYIRMVNLIEPQYISKMIFPELFKSKNVERENYAISC